jgi:hypothetical protein
MLGEVTESSSNCTESVTEDLSAGLASPHTVMERRPIVEDALRFFAIPVICTATFLLQQAQGMNKFLPGVNLNRVPVGVLHDDASVTGLPGGLRARLCFPVAKATDPQSSPETTSSASNILK